ncbi:EAL domain-containing protein [Paraburkholderia diazotrophica]|uniref:EAL domain, c-di-GMP-specific phosphodiesterase class I (Or its enzymatically inactive variant) n=1 Tax=Paraburkholderia diazotrophica TaxID=667676 RepID=A0A1H6YYY5_9BURK|nr:EAL domain-containing protein [Paraburkholderia diazotrophica]SEJ44297.1 EAL domain, c-di-GMP-specific phosphodiesterase class I (or its enzymatically inactive variant) [Paraburkholderia diazotrophica]
MHGQAQLFHEPYRTYQHAHTHEWPAENDLPPISAWYQPKFELATGKITGVEALARVMDPVHGALSAARLLESVTPAALRKLTYSMLSQTLVAQRDWAATGYPLTVSVNVPAGMLGERTAREHLLWTVRESGVKPEHIVLEIVETGSADDNAALPEATEELRTCGFGIAIDDFGIGHSSLLRLMQCHFTELKIDRAFVQHAEQDTRARAALDACVLVGKRLGLHITAEGVETAVDIERVRTAGCDYVQGFAISRALPQQALKDFLSRRQEFCAI